MEPKDRIIHRPWEVGGTWLTNAGNIERPKYEEAVRRYPGPAKIVLCDQAYVGTEKEQLVPGYFSVHVLNMGEVPLFHGVPALASFWDLVGPLRMPTWIQGSL